MKYAIIVDSACGLTQKQAEKLGWYYLPLHIEIDNVEYEDGVDITTKNLFEKYTKEADVKTSAINIGKTIELFEKLSKEYDKLFVYPISKFLSGTYQSLENLALEFPKLRVIKSVEVVQLIAFDLFWFENQMKKDPSKFEEYLQFIENNGFKKSLTLIPKYNKYLVKGGRLTPAAAIIAKMLNIVPLIKWEDGQLKKEGIGRNFKKTVLKNIEDKYDFFKQLNNPNAFVAYLHSNASEEEKTSIVAKFESLFNFKPYITLIAPVISIHTGPEAYAAVVIDLDKQTKEIIEEKIKLINE